MEKTFTSNWTSKILDNSDQAIHNRNFHQFLCPVTCGTERLVQQDATKRLEMWTSLSPFQRQFTSDRISTIVCWKSLFFPFTVFLRNITYSFWLGTVKPWYKQRGFSSDIELSGNINELTHMHPQTISSFVFTYRPIIFIALSRRSHHIVSQRRILLVLCFQKVCFQRRPKTQLQMRRQKNWKKASEQYLCIKKYKQLLVFWIFNPRMGLQQKEK